MSDVATRTGVEGADLLNLLNYVNFREGTVFVQFRHRRKGDALTFPAFPQPLHDLRLECLWLAPGLPAEVVAGYDVDEVLVSDGRTLVVVKPEVVELRRDRAVFVLPAAAAEKGLRKVHRYRTEGIEATLIQAGLRYLGHLVDFNAVSFRWQHEGPGAPFGLNPHEPVTVLIQEGDQLWYSGECRFARRDSVAEAVLTPLTSNLRRFSPKEFRQARQELVPRPRLEGVHPLTRQRWGLPVVNLAGGGLAVEEFADEAVLLPGLILGEVTLVWAGRTLLKAPVQVLHRSLTEAAGNRPVFRCGLAFLDLTIEAQADLAAVLQEGDDGRARVCAPVSEDELWRFFFESGFFYAGKYAALEGQRQVVQQTYRKLYGGPSPVARHFLYEDKGKLAAHMSMVRSHPQTWLIHHHAATHRGYVLAGVSVLDQAGRYLNDFHRLPSTHMDYVMCYFRRENKFPNRVFGGSAADVANPRAISIDDFAYLPLEQRPEAAPVAYQILPASAEDRRELARSYAQRSGGLLLEALNLGEVALDQSEINRAFVSGGLHRDHEVFAWKHQGVLKAVVAVHRSDPGLNLSNLTHCLHAFLVDSEGLSPDQWLAGLWDLRENLGSPELPLLVYPADALEGASVKVDKRYAAWVMNLDHLDGYFRSISRRFRRPPHGHR